MDRMTKDERDEGLSLARAVGEGPVTYDPRFVRERRLAHLLVRAVNQIAEQERAGLSALTSPTQPDIVIASGDRVGRPPEDVR
jgi:hypothetical protein